MRISKRLFHAVEAVLYIAYTGASDCIGSKEIAEKQGTTPRYLEQVMQKLVKSGILRGVRGPSGGYLLAREKRRISIADIYIAISEEEVDYNSTELGQKILQPVMDSMQELLTQRAGEITIADLYNRAIELSVAKTAKNEDNFTI
ncbi:MAG: Rrf2 family transcriptional regulator [Pseudomonadota bacterium]